MTAAVWMPIESVHAWDDNPRVISEQTVAAVAASIERFGFGAVLLAQPDGTLIAGHTRLRAAKRLGLRMVPVRVMDLRSSEARLLALADNKLGEISEWDDAQLVRVLAELSAEERHLVGFDEKDLQRLASLFELPDEEPIEVAAEVALVFEGFRMPMSKADEVKLKDVISQNVRDHGTLLGVASMLIVGLGP